MSLFNLIHKSVVIKFSDAAKDRFDPAASYVFRLTAVDGMGFLEIQDLKAGAGGAHETASEPRWINKDLVLEIHEFNPALAKGVLFTGPPAKPGKPKAPVKQKPVLE